MVRLGKANDFLNGCSFSAMNLYRYNKVEGADYFRFYQLMYIGLCCINNVY